MTETKAFGKLGHDELESYISMFRVFQSIEKELLDTDKSKLISELTNPFYWSTVYEHSFIEHIAMLVSCIGYSEDLSKIARSDNPQLALLESTSNLKANNEDWNGGDGGSFEKKHLLGLVFSTIKNIESIYINGLPLNTLLKQAKNGNDLAYFKAIKVDKTIISTPSFSDRLAIATLNNETDFFNKLGNAIKYKPENRSKDHDDLRIALFMLHDCQGLDSLSLEGAYKLFCLDLKLYPSDGEDAARSLWQFIRRWKKDVLST